MILRIEAEKYRRSFAAFCRAAWEHVDVAPLVWGRHLDALCAHLQAVTDGEIKRLIIEIPPGHAKSLISSVLWPAWRWTRDPSWAVITASYDLSLVTRDAVKTRTLIDSTWYQERFCDPAEKNAFGFTKDQNVKTYYRNTKGGERIAVAVGSGTGKRANSLIVDDALSASQAQSDKERERAVLWFSQTMSSRFNDQLKAEHVVIGQRLHEGDLPGELIRKGGYEVLRLPSEFVVNEPTVTRRLDGRVFFRDWRTNEGDLLFPEKFSAAVIAQAKLDLGADDFSAQHQQHPNPPGGSLIKREWFDRRWLLPGENPLPGYKTRQLPLRFEIIEIFTDAAFKDKATSDAVAIGVVGRVGVDVFLLDLVWARMNFTETCQALRDLHTKWKKVCNALRIEDKANGTAIIEVISKEVPCVIPIEPSGSKYARISAASRAIEAGNVWLPQSALVQTGDLVSEAAAFPRGRNDDGIDMLAYAINIMLLDSDFEKLKATVGTGNPSDPNDGAGALSWLGPVGDLGL